MEQKDNTLDSVKKKPGEGIVYYSKLFLGGSSFIMIEYFI